MNSTSQPTATSPSRQRPDRGGARRLTVNVPLLLGTVVLVAIALPAVYFWHKHRADATATTFLARANDLNKSGEHDEAVAYYQKFLLARPNDSEAMLGLIDAYSQGERSHSRLTQLNRMLYRGLGQTPDRHDLRLTLAENLLELGAYHQAADEAARVLEASPEHKWAARKVGGIAKFRLCDVDSSISRSEAIGELLAVAEQLPGDVKLVELTAMALRQHPEGAPSGTDAASKADELMDRLVEENPENAEAYLSRCQYRAIYRLPGAEQDVARGLELAPDNVAAMLIAASHGWGEAGATVAAKERTLRRVIELAPTDRRGYLALASLYAAEGRTVEAITLLTSANEATGHDLHVGLALAEMQLQAEQYEGAQATLAEVEKENAVRLPRLSIAERDLVANQMRLLEARYAASQGDLESAIAKLTTVMANSSPSDQSQSAQWVSAAHLLAHYQTRAGRTDQASQYWDALSAAMPGNLGVASESVKSYLATGNPQAAIDRLEEFSRTAELTPELMVRRVQAHLALQLARPAGERNWSEFDNSLAAAKQANQASRELVFAESQRLLSANDKPAAATTLRQAEEAFADDAAFWQMAAIAYLQLGEQSDVERALARFKDVSESPVDEAKLSTLILVRQQNFAAAVDLLSGLAGTGSEQEQQELLLLRAEVLRASGDVAAAFKLVEQALAKGESNVKLLNLGIDTALLLGKLETAQQWEEQLAQKTNNGFEARLARARRLAHSWEKLDQRERQDLIQLVNSLRTERPRWYPVATLSGSIAQLNGESRRALGEYQKAVELGERQHAVLQQVVILLYGAGRFDEVDRYMAMVAGDTASSPFFDMMAIEVAARQKGIAEALRLAKESVDRNPQDVERRLVLGSMLLGNNEAPEAVNVLQESAKEFPNDNRVWIALFNAYVRSDQMEVARKALGRLVTSPLLAVEKRHFVAGQGYEIIGDIPQAIEQYKLAIAALPTGVDARLRLANLLARQNPQQARAEFQRVLELEPTNTTAQRQFAILLANSGNQADWQAASELLSATAGTTTGDAASNDRLRAMLLSQQGRTRAERIANCRLARDIITPLIQRGGPAENDENRRVMAGILQREAILSGDNSLLLAARDEFRQAIDEGAPSAAELGGYIEFLLQSAETMRDSMPKEVETPPAESETARHRATFLSEAEKRLQELRRLPTNGDEGLAALIASMGARLQLARDDKGGAEATIKKFVEDRQDFDELDARQKSQRYLLFGQLLGVIEAHADAEQWYRRLMEDSPDAYVLVIESLISQGKRSEAAQLGLEKAGANPSPAEAKVLARILTVTSDEIPLDPEVEKALATAIGNNQEDIELLQAEAVMRASRGDYASAIVTMRKILEINPHDALTLNNLATLLAERPNERAEALELIGRAISVSGRNAMLLDTQGTIQLKLGDAPAAIASLEEATAGRATDARYYLHLAAAYELGGRPDDARRMLAEARAFGLENFVLTDDDRSMLSSLETSLASEESTPQ